MTMRLENDIFAEFVHVEDKNSTREDIDKTYEDCPISVVCFTVQGRLHFTLNPQHQAEHVHALQEKAAECQVLAALGTFSPKKNNF